MRLQYIQADSPEYTDNKEASLACQELFLLWARQLGVISA